MKFVYQIDNDHKSPYYEERMEWTSTCEVETLEQAQALADDEAKYLSNGSDEYKVSSLKTLDQWFQDSLVNLKNIQR